MYDLADETAHMDALSPLRRAKHVGFVTRKRVRWRYREAKFAVATRLFRDLDQRPWTYRPERYAETFLRYDDAVREESRLPEQVFAVWTGDNPLTANRARNLTRLRDELEVPVVLVTPENVGDWEVAEHPLHAAYEHLSLVHRSDYLRGYLMHHHGGGYADIKAPAGSWRQVFEEMSTDEDAWVMSYRTTDANWIGKQRGRIGRDILIRHRLMFGKGAFLMRSHTALTAEWLHEMERRLDRAAEALAESPGGGIYGADGYPLSWTDLLGRVLDPLTLKHHAHIRYDDRLLLDFTNYR